MEAYSAAFGKEPAVVAYAPGRVNLMGDHTDYNGGWVLPCAIDRWVAVAMDEGPGLLVSADLPQTETLTGCSNSAWAAHPRGVAWALADVGYSIPSFQAAYAGNVPRGSGLSSSAAIQVATCTGLSTLFQLEVPPRRMAQVCQAAENRFVGVDSGIMDQFVSIFALAGHALLLDCRSLEYRSIPLELEQASIRLVVCHTGTDRHLASSGYNERRAGCNEAAHILGISSLRDATTEDVDRLSGKLKRYCRHVVSENGRVLAAADALDSADFEAIGRLMFESHQSLRIDFSVSTPQLDEFVQAARDSGAFGARVTGAGFGGCGVALVPVSRSTYLEEETKRRYQNRGYSPPTFFHVSPSQGAVASSAGAN